MFRPEAAAARTRNAHDDRLEERLLHQLMDLLAVEHNRQPSSGVEVGPPRPRIAEKSRASGARKGLPRGGSPYRRRRAEPTGGALARGRAQFWSLSTLGGRPGAA